MSARRRSARRESTPRRVRLSHWRADGEAKVRYGSRDEANRAVLGYLLEHRADLSPYKCEFCGGWHLGSE